MRSSLLLVSAWGVGAAVFAFLQWSTPNLIDRDSYYHARYAQMLPDRGLSREFPWTQESVWKDRFADKEFLFHVWLVPFCRSEDPVGGAKVAAWALDCLLLGVFAFVVSRNGIRAPWLWVILVLALGNHFLFRIQEVRSQVLSVLILLIGIHFLLQARWRALAVVGFVYSWSYSAPHLLVIFAGIDALARTAADRRFEWRGVAFSAAGVLAGLVIHPYFPNDLEMWWIINARILPQAWGMGGDIGVRLGEEFEPILPRSLIVSSTLVFVCFLGMFLGACFRGEALSRRSRLLICYALGGFLMYCLSARFIEYFAPLALLAAASTVSDLWAPRPGLIAAVCSVLVLGLFARSVADTRTAVRNYPGPDLAGAARWARNHIPEGETIVHLEWGEFVQLFCFDPKHRYLVGLDPMFLYVQSPSRLRLIEDVRAGRRPLNPKELAETFHSRFLVLRKRLESIADDVGLTPIYRDEDASIYTLRE